jgi:hypothetical protein
VWQTGRLHGFSFKTTPTHSRAGVRCPPHALNHSHAGLRIQLLTRTRNSAPDFSLPRIRGTIVTRLTQHRIFPPGARRTAGPTCQSRAAEGARRCGNPWQPPNPGPQAAVPPNRQMRPPLQTATSQSVLLCTKLTRNSPETDSESDWSCCFPRLLAAVSCFRLWGLLGWGPIRAVSRAETTGGPPSALTELDATASTPIHPHLRINEPF